MYTVPLSIHPAMGTYAVPTSWLKQTWGCRCLVEILLSFILDMYPEPEVVDHMVVLLLIL